MKARRNLFLTVIFAVFGLLVALPNIGTAETLKTLKIGCIMPFTGPWGVYGHALEPGIQIYADLLNEDGGVQIGKDKYKIEMIFVDDEADPAKGPIAAQELIRKGAVANVGCFSVTPPIGAVLEPAKILFVGQMKMGFDLDKNKHFIGAYGEIYTTIYMYHAIMEMWPDVKKIGHLCYGWQKMQCGKTVEVMREPWTVFSKKGIEIIEDYHTMGQPDFTTSLAKFKEFGVDCIITIVGPGDYALLSKQAHEMGMDVKFFNPGTATNIDDFIKIAGYENAQGMSFNWPAPWAMDKTKVNPELIKMALRIKDRYQEKYKKPMTYIGGFDWGINHLRVLLDFYQQAGTLDPDKVMEKVRGGTVTDFAGTWTMGGEKTWGSPVIKPTGCLVGKIKGNKVVYGAQYRMPTIP